MEYFTEFGYAGLFFASFFAATILPFSSEIVLSLLLINGLDPFLLITTATAGNVLGAFINYAAGFWGSQFVTKKILNTTDKAFAKARERFRKYGTACLFFAWVPVIGDPLTVVAGVLRISLPAFFILVSSGKLIRYIVIGYIVMPK